MTVQQSTNVSGPNAGELGIGRRIFHRVAQFRGAVELGWYDFINGFRRSYVGPLWATAQMGLWIATLTLIFGDRMEGGVADYAVYVALGFFAWDFISWSLGEGPGHLASKGAVLKNIPVALSQVTVRRVSYLVFRSAFQLPVPIVVVGAFGDWPGASMLLLAPAIILFLLSSYACLTICGVIGIYFRDFEFLMPTLTRFLFFMTPIFWTADSGLRKLISTYNPFSYYIELVREPMTGGVGSPLAWMIVTGLSVSGFAFAIFLQQRFRTGIIYRI